MTDDSFLLNVIDPIISAYIDNTIEDVTYYGNDHQLSESKFRKLNQAEELDTTVECVKGRIPDCSAAAQADNNNHHVFLCEVKTEKASTNRPDLVKLGSMLKDCIDFEVIHDIDHVVGLSIEGRTCTLYCMDLPIPRLYRMIEIDTFFLPTSYKGFMTLNSTLGMIKCRSLVINYAITHTP